MIGILLSIVFFVWAVFAPQTAVVFYTVFLILFELGVFLGVLALEKREANNFSLSGLSLNEIIILREYHFYFSHPRVSRSLASVLAAIQWTSPVWVIGVFWAQLCFLAVFFGVNYFIARALSIRFNPGPYLHREVKKKGRSGLTTEMRAFDALSEKILISGSSE